MWWKRHLTLEVTSYSYLHKTTSADLAYYKLATQSMVRQYYWRSKILCISHLRPWWVQPLLCLNQSQKCYSSSSIIFILHSSKQDRPVTGSCDNCRKCCNENRDLNIFILSNKEINVLPITATTLYWNLHPLIPLYGIENGNVLRRHKSEFEIEDQRYTNKLSRFV